MLVVLQVNGFQVEATDPELASWILGLATGTSPEQLAELIRRRLSPAHWRTV
jgi:hypothetical protein